MDRQKVSVLYEKYADIVVRAALNFTFSIHTAQDCAEEAFLRLMQHEEMEQSHYLPWLIRTAVNIAKDIARSAEKRHTVPLDELGDSSTDDSCTIAERAARRAMFSLDELYRLPLYLYLVEGYSMRATAQLLGKSLYTTASLICRGRKKLKDAYEKEVL